MTARLHADEVPIDTALVAALHPAVVAMARGVLAAVLDADASPGAGR